MFGMLTPDIIASLQSQGRTERIPTPPPRSMMDAGQPMQPQPQIPGAPQGMGQNSRSIFDSYMSQIYNQKYKPQQALGGYQNMGSYGGFMPQMGVFQQLMQAASKPSQGGGGGAGIFNPMDRNDPRNPDYSSGA